MKRGQPMKRTAMLRRSPSASTSTPVERKEKEGTCAQCGNPFLKLRPMQNVCGPVCAGRKAKADRLAKVKADRQGEKVRKAALKTRRNLIAEAQAAVNRYCRLKDQLAGKGCVSCGAKPDPRYGGTVDAGHYRSVGAAPHLRFLTCQIRLQCVRCNRYLSGNVVEYRKALVAERGEPWVQWLDSLQGVAKWDREYLTRLKRIANKKTRRMEKRHGL
jgi:hypothetical protein